MMGFGIDRLARQQTATEREIRRLRRKQTRGAVSSTRIQGPLPPAASSLEGGVSGWINDSGATRVRGTVVVASGDRLFDTTTTEGDRRVIGVVDSASVADLAEARVRHIGYQSAVRVVGAVVAGDLLRSSTTVGCAESIGAGFNDGPGVFARALAASAGPGEASIPAYVFPPTLVSAFYAIEFPLGGDEITTGIALDFTVPYDLEVLSWTLLGDQTGSLVLDLWLDTYANYPPDVADSVTGSEKPTITTAIKGQDLALTSWSNPWLRGETVRVNVDSVTDIARATLILDVLKL